MGSFMLLALCGPAFALSSSLLAPGMNLASINGSSVYSTNWSGYAVTGSTGSVTSVSGSWTAPALATNSGSALAAFWVGIDGYSSNTVEQTGTLIATTSAQRTYGVPEYCAWYEFYPAGMVIISTSNAGTPATVTPGDMMYATVTYAGSNTFTATITDMTAGWTFTSPATTVSGAKESSAEWIAEAPSSSRGVLPLADFGKAYYGDYYTTVPSTCYATTTTSGGSQPISYFSSNVQTITMVYETFSRGHATIVPKATPSGLSSDGTGFYVTWNSAGSSGLVFDR